jgi:hypothetical protein
MKNKGPKIEPWGTPHLIVSIEWNCTNRGRLEK